MMTIVSLGIAGVADLYFRRNNPNPSESQRQTARTIAIISAVALAAWTVAVVIYFT